MDVTLPPLAEGADSGTIVSVLVSVGDEIKTDQSVVEIENEKAIAPIPSPGSGKVTAVHVKEGDTLAVGQKIISIDEGGEAKPDAPKTEPAPAESAPKAQPVAASPAPAQPAIAAAPAAVDYQYQSPSSFPPPASPSVRRIAAEIGLDLSRVQGSEHGGRIVMKDIKAYIQSLQQRVYSSVPAVQTAPAATAAPLPAYKLQSVDFSKWGPVTTKPYSSMRKTIGSRMHEAWSTIPHVYQMDEADITALMVLRNKHKEAYKKAGASLTLTAIAVKVTANTLKSFPNFNTSLDEAKEELVYKSYYNIAIAVDTEAGLVVPVIRNADKKDLLEIAKELGAVAEKARERKLTTEDMEGSTFTISNLGGIGGTYFTPIIKKPDAAILGIGKGIIRPVFNDKNKIEACSMLPLCVSYDHRIIDGADGARFITELVIGFQSISEADIKISSSSSAKPSAAKKAIAKKAIAKKATVKKAAAKQSTVKQSTVKQSTVKQSTPKKSTTKKGRK